jgi:hypothetical protein
VFEASDMIQKVESSHSMKETQIIKTRKKTLKTTKKVMIFQIMEMNETKQRNIVFFVIQKYAEKVYSSRVCFDAR